MKVYRSLAEVVRDLEHKRVKKVEKSTAVTKL